MVELLFNFEEGESKDDKWELIDCEGDGEEVECERIGGLGGGEEKVFFDINMEDLNIGEGINGELGPELVEDVFEVDTEFEGGDIQLLTNNISIYKLFLLSLSFEDFSSVTRGGKRLFVEFGIKGEILLFELLDVNDSTFKLRGLSAASILSDNQLDNSSSFKISFGW